MFAHFIACFLQYYQKTLNNHFSLVFHVASGIVSKTGTSTVYQFLWHFLFNVLIFQPLLCDWCYSELPAVIWRSLCQVKVSLKNRMGYSRLGVAYMEFILSGFPSLLGVFTLLALIWTYCPSAVTRTFLMNFCLNGLIYRYWVFFHTCLFILLCCFCFPLGVRGEESLPLPPSIDQFGMTELSGSTGLLVCFEAPSETEHLSLWSCIRQFVFISGIH